MVTRSQRHKEEVHGYRPVGPPVDQITLSLLSPANGEAETTMALSIFGSGFEDGDIIVFGGTEYQSDFVNQGQIKTLVNDPIATGAVRTVQVTVKRDELISNALPFTVYAPAVVLDTLFDRANESPGAGNVDSAVTVGLTFYTIGGQTGEVKRISFWKPADDPTTARAVGVYNQAGTLITSTTTSGEAAGPGWVDVTLPSPVSITAGAYFTAAVHYPNAAGHYPAEAGRFNSSPKPSVGGKFYGSGTGEHIGNGTYKYGATLDYPNSGTAGANFWVDIGFEADAA